MPNPPNDTSGSFWDLISDISRKAHPPAKGRRPPPKQPSAKATISILQALKMYQPGYVTRSVDNPTGSLGPPTDPRAALTRRIASRLQASRDKVTDALLRPFAEYQIHGRYPETKEPMSWTMRNGRPYFHVDAEELMRRGMRDVDAQSAKYRADLLNDDPEPEEEIAAFEGPKDRPWTAGERYESLINTLQRSGVLSNQKAHLLNIGKPDASLWEQAQEVAGALFENPETHYNMRKLNQLTKAVLPYGVGAMYGPKGVLRPEYQDYLRKTPEGTEFLATIQNLDPTQMPALADTVSAKGGVKRTVGEFKTLFERASKGDPFAIAEIKAMFNATVISSLLHEGIPMLTGGELFRPAFTHPSKPGSFFDFSGGAEAMRRLPYDMRDHFGPSGPDLSSNNRMIKGSDIVTDTNGDFVVMGAGRSNNKAIPGTRPSGRTFMAGVIPRLRLSPAQIDKVAYWSRQANRLPSVDEARSILSPKGGKASAATEWTFGEVPPGAIDPRIEAFMPQAKIIAARAAKLKPGFDVLIDGVAKKFGGKADHGPSKLAPRIAEKLLDAEGVTAKLKDAVRSSIILSDVGQAQAAMAALKKEFPTAILKDTFDKPSSSGYRDIKVWIPYKGTTAEIALHVPEMYDAKKITHPLYSKWRISDDPTLEALMAKIHNLAWEQFTRRMTRGRR